MNRTSLSAFLCALLVPVAALAAGRNELDRFVGTWDAPGSFVTTPYSKAGHADAVNSCAWSTDHIFVICQQSISIDGALQHAISIYTFDDAAMTYHFYNLRPDGASSTKISVAGNTIIYSDSFTDKGQTVTIRTLNVWETPDRYRWRTEYSLDGGTTWRLMASGLSQRRRNELKE